MADNVNTESQTQVDSLQDPPVVRTKGCGTSTSNVASRQRRTQACGSCGGTGHNRHSCPISIQSGMDGEGVCAPFMSADYMQDGGDVSNNTQTV